MKPIYSHSKLHLALAAIGLFSQAGVAWANVDQVNQIVYDGTDSSLLDGNKHLIPQENGKNITQDNHVLINFDPNDSSKITPRIVNGGLNENDQNFSVKNTSVTLENGKVGGEISGAKVNLYYDASKNTPYSAEAIGKVTTKNGEVQANVTGAEVYAGGTANDYTGSTFTADGILIVDGGNLTRTITGAVVNDSTLSANSNANGLLIMNGGGGGSFVYGAYASGKNNIATGRVEIHGGIAKNHVYGAHTARGETSKMNGSILMTGGRAEKDLRGVYNNINTMSLVEGLGKVVVEDGYVGGDVLASTAFIHHNTTNKDSFAISDGEIDISGGEIGGFLQAAWASSKKDSRAKGRINLTGGTLHSSNIYVSRVRIDELVDPDDSPYGIALATDSTLTVGEDVTFTNPDLSIWGGVAMGAFNEKDAVSGNTFNFYGKPLEVSKLGNFQNYNFYLTDANSQLVNTNDALITVKDELHSEDSWMINADGNKVVTTNHPNILLKGISGEQNIQVGDEVHLLSADGAAITMGDQDTNTSDVLTSELFNHGEQHSIQHGLVGKIGVEYEFDDANNRVTAKFVEDSTVDEDLVDLNVKPLVEGRLAALMNITRKNRLEENVLKQLQPGEAIPFVTLLGGHNRYQSGSHISADTFDLLTGIGYKKDKFAMTAFASYGYDDYKTYNHFNQNQVKGSGNNKSYGVGFSSQYDVNKQFYTSFGAQFGRIANKFDSRDIVTGSGDYAKYKSKVNYWSGHLGAGYRHHVDENNLLDTSLHYVHSKLGSDAVHIDGDKIDFESLKSNILELKTRWEHKISDNAALNTSLGYEYEFDGKGDASVAGIAIDAPRVKGSTGFVGIGFKYQPKGKSSGSLLSRSSIDLDAIGYVGKRRGGKVALTYKYTF